MAHHHKDLKRLLAFGASGSLLVKIAGAALEFAVHVLLARVLGANQYGIYIYVLTWVSVLAMLATLGFDTASIRFVASYNARGEWGLLRGFMATVLRLVLLSSSMVAVILGIIVMMFVAGERSVFAPTFLVGVFLLPLISLTRLRQATLRALKHVVRAELPYLVIRPLVLALCILGVSVYNSSLLTAREATVFNTVATLAALLVATIWLMKLVPTPIRSATKSSDTRHWLLVALPLLFISGMQLILSQTDVIMLGAMLDAKHAGIYAATARIAGFIAFGLMAANAIVAPMIAEHYDLQQRERLQGLLTLAARGAFAFGLVVGTGLVVFGRFVLLLFGEEFVVAYPALLILLVGEIINTLMGSVGFLMTMTGHQVKAAWILGASAMLNILLNALLIPQFGMNGAAVATATTIVLWNVVMFLYVRSRLGLNPTMFSARY